jgi:hypothetical protein
MSMTITLDINPSEVTPRDCAKLTLTVTGGASSQLDIDFRTLLRRVDPPQDAAYDLLLFATMTYAADKLVRRSTAPDRWRRDMEMVVPVAEPDRWGPVADELARCLNFLTGDSWRLRFSKRKHTLVIPPEKPRRRNSVVKLQGDTVCMLSGGVDSAVGAIDWLETNSGCLVVAGHHDTGIAGPLSDQQRVLAALQPHYEGRIGDVLVGIGLQPPGQEITLRSRSLLFIALGVFLADALGSGVPLLLPENGTISLNVPLTPSRRGSCSTRTAHPHYLRLLQSVIDRLGLAVQIHNPLLSKTKGEAVAQCRNQPVMRGLLLETASCAKRGHKETWINRTARSCGRCMPCVYRRAAFHGIELDTEVYGVDVCKGQLDLDDRDGESADDFRACLSFLRQGHSQNAVARMLLASGPLPVADLPQYAATVCRAMDEVRRWLRDKARVPIKRRAGLGN